MSLEVFLTQAKASVAADAYQATGPRVASNGSLVQALAHSPLIAELKIGSPSAGSLLRGTATGYLASVARAKPAAFSIVTAGGAFQGHPGLLALGVATGRPVLMKDFVIDEAQLEFASRQGASAVLLIERCLTPARRDHLIAAAHGLGLEVLLEAATMEEAELSVATEADLIGLNARDLATLAVNRAGATAMLATVAPKSRKPVLLLSGVSHPMQVDEARAAGAAGVLVGSALLCASSPFLLAAGLSRPIAKVCGLTCARDVAIAAEAGADLGGIVVGCDSPRSVTPAVARALADQLRAAGIPPVLVTRGVTAAELEEMLAQVQPDFVQPHACALPAAFRQRLASRLLAPIAPGQVATGECAAFVLDSSVEGGSGATHRWTVQTNAPCLVAGGLDNSNAAQAIAASHAWGADASSRLETDGRKDAAKVRAFVAAVQRSRRPRAA